MATIDLGKVAFTHKGTYNSGTTYEDKDVVQFTDGDITSTFVYINSTSASGQTPSTGGTVNSAYWSLMAKGQPQTFNSTNLTNDISTLAIRQATSENKGAYNTNSMYVDVFQDSTGITNLTNASRNVDEYMSTISFNGGLETDSVFMADGVSNLNDKVNSITGSTNDISNAGGTPTTSSTNRKWTGYDVIDANSGTIKYDGIENYWNGSGAYTVDFWLAHKSGGVTGRNRLFTWDATGYYVYQTYGVDYGSGSADFNAYANNNGVAYEYPVTGTFNLPTTDLNWHHYRYVRDASNNHYYYFDGTLVGSRAQSGYGSDSSTISNRDFRISGRRSGSTTGTEFVGGYYTDVIITPRALSTGSSYTVPTEKAQQIANATGSFESNAITAPSNISKMGAIVSYKDASGTNALNTDIVLKLSADNGSNYATATLSALPNYSSSIKMAKVNDVTVTAGTNLKYKLEFANQAVNSKEAQILGVSLMY